MMENLTLATIFSGLLSVVSPQAIEQSTIQVHNLPAIAGLWEIDLGETSCQERYNFAPDGKLNTTSGEEITIGEYGFVYVEESQLPVLATTTLHDNNGVDCSGSQVDQTGQAMAVFVKLNHKHSPTVMQWCSDPQGQDCQATLRRILP